jgi:2-isopropylmalate synthase
MVRVLIESGDERDRWGTVGVSPNVIEASWQALVDSIEYKLYKDKKVKGKPIPFSEGSSASGRAKA